MKTIKLTPAQKNFIERFDAYTLNGRAPKDFRHLREEWRVQSRTMNWCHKMGLIKKTSQEGMSLFVVNPQKRIELGLPELKSIETKKLSPRKRIVRIFVG